jgi:hypothetical protein
MSDNRPSQAVPNQQIPNQISNPPRQINNNDEIDSVPAFLRKKI